MPDYVYHDGVDTGKFVKYVPSIDPSQAGANSVEISGANTASQRSLVASLPSKYLKIVNGLATEKTQQEKDSADAAEAAALLTSLRNGAKTIVDSLGSDAKVLRAVLLLILDELNDLRKRDRDRAVDVAASANLADLKTRWAAQSTLSDRTATQARNAIKNKIDAGDADS